MPHYERLQKNFKKAHGNMQDLKNGGRYMEIGFLCRYLHTEYSKAILNGSTELHFCSAEPKKLPKKTIFAFYESPRNNFAKTCPLIFFWARVLFLEAEKYFFCNSGTIICFLCTVVANYKLYIITFCYYCWSSTRIGAGMADTVEEAAAMAADTQSVQGGLWLSRAVSFDDNELPRGGRVGCANDIYMLEEFSDKPK